MKDGTAEEKYYKGNHYKVAIHWKKRDSDKVIPTRVTELKIRFEQTKGCSNWTVLEYLTNRDFYKRRVFTKTLLNER